MATVPEATPQRDVLLRYTNGAVIIHWLTAAFIVAQVVLGFTFSEMDRGPARGEVFAWHKTIGATILVLAIVRLLWRLTHKPPPFPEELPRWERLAATWSHRAFYVLIIALPLTGLATISAGESGFTTLVGGIQLPLIPGLPEDADDFFEDAHELLVRITLALLAIHVGAALKHQFIDRSRAAGRMPPFRAPEGEATASRG